VLIAYAFDNAEMTARGYRVADDTFVPLPGVAPVASVDPAAGVRDPSLASYGGRYYLAATKPRRSDYLGIGATSLQLWRSGNLADWTPLPDVPAGVPNASRAWAPELLVDGDDVYLYYAVSTDTTALAWQITGFAIYARRATSPDLDSWGPPQRMTGLTGAKVIDPQVTRVNDPRGAYVMVFKDETTLTISRAWSATPLGPWTTDRTGNWIGETEPAEGPELVRRPDGGWRLYYDQYASGHLVYRDSDDLDTWSTAQPLSYSPTGLRHPGYLRITTQEWSTLVDRRRAVRAYTTAWVPVPNNRSTPVPLGTSDGDTELWTAAQPTRLVAPTAGWYSLRFTLRWAVNPVGQRSAAYRFFDGVMQYEDSRAATLGGMGTEHGGGDEHFWLPAGGYVEIMALHTSGGPLGVLAVASFAREN
jgi:hypothetical protein